MGGKLTYGSVCSGIEAATAAWHPLGWKPAFFSEIEAFPRAVLQHHYPEVPLHGDFTTIQDGDYDPIDLLVGGTPCQSFSVAGLRGGLSDERGNLALEYLRLAQRLRPRWLVWENVPGVLSSRSHDAPPEIPPGDDLAPGCEREIIEEYEADERSDFACFLAGLQELGYGFAYRVLDAQFFGLAQRRRRVFVVGYLGDWRRAAAVLFERHSMQGHPAPRREAGKSAPTIPSRSSAGGGLGTDFDCDGGLIEAFGGNNQAGPIDVATAVNAHGGPHGRLDFESETFVAHSLRGEGFDASEDGTGRGTPIVPVAYSIMPQNSGKDYKARAVDVAQPVMAGGPVGGNQGGDYIVHAIQAGALRENPDSGPDGVGVQADHAYTLEARAEVQAIAFALRGREGGAMPEIGGDRVGSLRAASGGSSRDYVAFNTSQDPIHGDAAQPLGAKDNGHGLLTDSAVRRLTPEECEALQGFPRGFTQIPWRKGLAPDGPRYKALGNSMAVPVMAWIGQRIEAVEAISNLEQAA